MNLVISIREGGVLLKIYSSGLLLFYYVLIVSFQDFQLINLFVWKEYHSE